MFSLACNLMISRKNFLAKRPVVATRSDQVREQVVQTPMEKLSK